VAYSRWPIEQCFREEKDELGFDHLCPFGEPHPGVG
jgi:hypothetical protein